jgi:hypothetical protein
MRVSVVATGIDAQVGMGQGPKQVVAPPVDSKRPPSFGAAAKPEPQVKPVIRPAESTQSESHEAQQVRSATVSEEGVRPLMREPASAAPLPDLSSDMYTEPKAPLARQVETDHEEIEKIRPISRKSPKHVPHSDGFFKRSFAGISRAFAVQRAETDADEEYYEAVQERVHVTRNAQAEVTEKSPRTQQSDNQDLDIPAFLRRQAN